MHVVPSREHWRWENSLEPVLLGLNPSLGTQTSSPVASVLCFPELRFPMQIVLNPKVKKVLIAILILVLVEIVFLVLRPALLTESAVSANQQVPDSLAAVDAVIAFYTLDSAESSELWAARVCAYATEQGCAIFRTYFAPTISHFSKYYSHLGGLINHSRA